METPRVRNNIPEQIGSIAIWTTSPAYKTSVSRKLPSCASGANGAKAGTDFDHPRRPTRAVPRLIEAGVELIEVFFCESLCQTADSKWLLDGLAGDASNSRG